VGGTGRERLEALQDEIRPAYGFFGLHPLHKAVRKALDEPAPAGSPGVLGKYAQAIDEAGQSAQRQRLWVREYAKDPLPDVWTGTAASGAAAALTALDNELNRMADTLSEAAGALGGFSAAVLEAQSTDRKGIDQLDYALSLLHDLLDGYDSTTMQQAHHAALDGIAIRVRAAHQIEQASRQAVRLLGIFAAKARAARLPGRGFSDVDRLLLADAANPGTGPHDGNLILTADASGRAAARLDRLAGDDRRRFDALLSGALSTQERAYLLQALAAGYRMRDIEAFARKIHPHGADPLWLERHLTPVTEADAPDDARTRRPVAFDGTLWGQGSEPTCVALSTVLARARVDPLYALELTTGGHPGDPAQDSGDGFARRLHAEQHRVYDDGRNWLQDLFGRDGMTEGQARDAANDEVATRTGARYDEVAVDSVDDRRAVLGDVERAVDLGLPVTFTVQGETTHQMAVIGHEGNLLQVYNPWGYTVWVHESDFVGNRMDLIQDGVPPKVTTVNVPRR
jgi:hypothetical protein